uniref:Uncharacterized protein n=1 Tax=viral metagenome TaxID=1070528 RepID=A0A6M3JTX1_9ZZZZ
MDYGNEFEEEGGYDVVQINVAAVSRKTRGIKDSGGVWFNMAEGLRPEDKKKLIEKMEKINSGDEVTLRCNPRSTNYSEVTVVKKAETRDDYIGFEEVLKKAHEKFKDALGIETEIIIAGPDVWLAKATVKIGDQKDHRTFTGHGDATKDNVASESIQKALPRMAETRAIARALRFALGEGTVAEELSGDTNPQPPEERARTKISKPGGESASVFKNPGSLIDEALEREELE